MIKDGRTSTSAGVSQATRRCCLSLRQLANITHASVSERHHRRTHWRSSLLIMANNTFAAQLTGLFDGGGDGGDNPLPPGSPPMCQSSSQLDPHRPTNLGKLFSKIRRALVSNTAHDLFNDWNCVVLPVLVLQNKMAVAICATNEAKRFIGPHFVSHCSCRSRVFSARSPCTPSFLRVDYAHYQDIGVHCPSDCWT